MLASASKGGAAAVSRVEGGGFFGFSTWLGRAAAGMRVDVRGPGGGGGMSGTGTG